ncbi:MAG: hypothetical protein J5872_04515 [Lachnospiraceae bacterium]|nr:hypothetical protein [Lachnospiraceae bacterium]
MFFADKVSGKVVAWGDLPSGWVDNTSIIGTKQSFGRPFTAVVELRRADSRALMFYQTGECFHQIKFGQGERHRERAFDERTMMPEATFRLPENYLDRLALFYSSDHPVKLFAKEPFPGFQEEPEMVAELKRSTARLEELCSMGIVVDLQNVFADAAIRTYRLDMADGVYSLCLAVEITATEYCLRTAPDSIFARRVTTPVDGMTLGVGMTVATIRKRAGARFGSAKTGGAKAAYIDWEARKVFGLLFAGEPRQEMITMLRNWIVSFRIDPDLYPSMKWSAADADAAVLREQNEKFNGIAERERDRRMNIIRTNL